MSCPDRRELSDFALGKLTAEAIDVVAHHVDHCPNCQATIVKLSGSEDTFLAQVKQAKRISAAEVDASRTAKKPKVGASQPSPAAARIDPLPGVASMSTTGGRAMALSGAEFAKQSIDFGLVDETELTTITAQLPPEKQADAVNAK